MGSSRMETYPDREQRLRRPSRWSIKSEKSGKKGETLPSESCRRLSILLLGREFDSPQIHNFNIMKTAIDITIAWFLLAYCWLASAADPAVPTKTVWTREVKTMEEACDLKKGMTSKSGGLMVNPKAMQWPKAPYAEGSFSSSAYRENVTSDLLRRHEEAFGRVSSANAASSNLTSVVSNNAAKVKIPVQSSKGQGH